MEDPEITRKVGRVSELSVISIVQQLCAQVKAFLAEHGFTQNALCAAVGCRYVTCKVSIIMKLEQQHSLF